MQLALLAAGKLFAATGIGGAAAAGTTAATAAGTAATAAGTAATAAGTAASGASGFSAASAFSTALQILGGLGAGVSAQRQANDMAAQTDLQAGQEQVQTTQRQTAMKRQLLQVLGENDVTFASAGIDISSGIAASSAKDAKSRAAQEISIDRNDTEFKRAILRMRANGQRAQGNAAMGGALLGALGTGVKAGLDLRTVG